MEFFDKTGVYTSVGVPGSGGITPPKSEVTVAPAQITARTDANEAQQALGKPLPIVIGTGRVDGVYFVGGVETVSTVTTTTTPVVYPPTYYYGQPAASFGVFLWSPPTVTAVTETQSQTMAGYVLAYDVFERGYNLVRLEIDGNLVYDAEASLPASTTFRFYGGRHTATDEILTEIIGANAGAYQNFVMIFIDGYPADSPPSVSAVISNSSDAATYTPITGPYTAATWGAALGAYDVATRLFYQQGASATLHTLSIDSHTEIASYSFPPPGSPAFVRSLCALHGSGYMIASFGDVAASYPAVVFNLGTGSQVASQVPGKASAIGWTCALDASAAFPNTWLALGSYDDVHTGAEDTVVAVFDTSTESLNLHGSSLTMDDWSTGCPGRVLSASASFFIISRPVGTTALQCTVIKEITWNGTALSSATAYTVPAGYASGVHYDPQTGYLVVLVGDNSIRIVNPATGALIDTVVSAVSLSLQDSNVAFKSTRLFPALGTALFIEQDFGRIVWTLDLASSEMTKFAEPPDYGTAVNDLYDGRNGIFMVPDRPDPGPGHWLLYGSGGPPKLIDLEDIITDSMSIAGFGPSDLTFEGIAGQTSYGFVIASDTTIQNVVRSIADIYGFAWCDTGAGFLFKKAAQDELFVIDTELEADDIVEADQPVQSSDDADIRTPSAVELQYVSKEGGYKARPVSFNMTTGVLNSITTPKFSTPILFNDAEAQRIVQEKFFEYQEKRRSHRLAAAPEHIVLLPGDIVSFPSGQRTYITRVEEIGIDLRNMGVEISARDFQTDVETDVTAVSNTGLVWELVSMASRYVHLDMPLLLYADDTAGASLVQYGVLMPSSQALWSGASLFRSPVTTGYVPIFQQLPHPGVQGVCETLLGPPADPFALDDTSTVNIRRTTADATLLVDATEAEVLDGVNNALIGVEGRWEWVGFKTVVDNGGGSYTLGGFTLRGYRGSEVFCGLHEIGDVFIMIGDWVRRMGHPIADLGDTFNYKAAGFGQNLNYLSATQHVIPGTAETPYAPTSLVAEEGVSGGIDITWDYRSRITTGFNSAEHGEATLAFQVDIYDTDGTTYIRTLTTTTNSVHYASADVITDFGSDPPAECNFRVYMMSALPILVAGQDRPVAGRGYEARGHFPVVMLLLSGDMQSGTDHLKLSGDAAPGNILVSEE